MINSNSLVDITALKGNKFKNITKENITDKNLKNVCNDFESFFMTQLLDVSLKDTKVAGQGVGADIIKGLYTQSIAQQSSGSLGISDMLYKFLSENKR